MPIKKSNKNPKNKKSSSKLFAGDRNVTSTEHYNAVLIENLTSEFKFVVEKVNGLEGQFKQELKSFREENAVNFEIIKKTLMHHSDLFIKMDKRMEGIENKMARMESKMDQIVEKVEKHDHEIDELKSLNIAQ